MKKILFTLVALVASMSISAQVVRLYKNGNLVASFNKNHADEVVFEDAEGAGAVDLGLSVKWATCNLGANNPEDVGNYYAWGETFPQEDKTYYWSSYKWCNGSLNSLTKYCNDSSYGQVDNKTMLLSADDAAQKNLPQGWRMPTQAEMQELIDKCAWKWTTKNGTPGYEVTASNGNSIFLPVTGAYGAKELTGKSTQGYYWTSTLTSTDNNYGVACQFFSTNKMIRNILRCIGAAIRPVYVSEHEYVDLGLSVKWATCNVGASKPEEYGDYYDWGATEPNTFVPLNFYNTNRYHANSCYWNTTLLKQDDVASVNWGSSWRIPTALEWIELYEKCSRSYEEYKGVPGLKFTGPNGNSIFLPAAGYFYDNNMQYKDIRGKYWSSSIYISETNDNLNAPLAGWHANCLFFSSTSIYVKAEICCFASYASTFTPIRPVRP